MTREQIETLITDNITTNSNGEITAIKVKTILDAIATDYRHLSDEITLSQVTDLVSSLAGKQATLTATNIKTIVDSLVEMTTPIDADKILSTDSAGTTAKKLSWTNVKAFLKTYFDGIYQSILVSGTNIKTINGLSILGSGNLDVSSGGVFGISNSSGIYTYYSTLTLAMASATAGQTIEMFADYTETGAVTITCKNGVNINGNNHTYNCTSSGVNLQLFTNVSGGICTIKDLIVNHTNSHGNSASIYLLNGSFDLNGSEFKKDAGFIIQNQGGKIYNGIFTGTGTTIGLLNQGGEFIRCISKTVNGSAISNNSGITSFCLGITTGTGHGLLGSNFYNCQGMATGGGYGAYVGSSHNVLGYSTANVGIVLDAGKCTNLTAISSGNFGAQVTASSIEVTGFRFMSTAQVGLFTQFVSGNIFNNGFIQSSVGYGLNTNSAEIFNNVYFKSTYNNALGSAVNIQVNDNLFVNCTFDVTNASANCITSASAKNVKYIRSAFKGATTPVNANITQTQTNTEDNQGNLTIN